MKEKIFIYWDQYVHWIVMVISYVHIPTHPEYALSICASNSPINYTLRELEKYKIKLMALLKCVNFL